MKILFTDFANDFPIYVFIHMAYQRNNFRKQKKVSLNELHLECAKLELELEKIPLECAKLELEIQTLQRSLLQKDDQDSIQN